MLGGVASELNVLPIFMKHARIQGIFVGHREGFEAMNRFIAEHELRPVIDQVFDLSETRAALEHLASGEHFGKICIRV